MPKQTISPTLALLGLLFHGKRYGYELKRTIDQEFASYWRIDFAQLYRSLAKMTKAKWVSVSFARGEGGPGRKVYTVTPKGRAAFRDWVAQPARSRDEFFVKVHLAGECGLSVAHLIEPQRRALETNRAKHSEAQRAAQDNGKPGGWSSHTPHCAKPKRRSPRSIYTKPSPWLHAIRIPPLLNRWSSPAVTIPCSINWRASFTQRRTRSAV